MQTRSSVSAKRTTSGVSSNLPRIFEAAGPGEDRGDRVGRGRLALLMLAIVAGDGAVRRLGLDRLAVGRHQDRGHQAERAEALGDLVRLDVAVVILAGPDELAAPLERGGDHVVDQAMLIFDPGLVELGLEFGVEDFLENVLEAAVIGLEDGVLGRQIDRPAALEAEVEAGARESRGSNRRGCTCPWRRRPRGSRTPHARSPRHPRRPI